jgi:hypothetical protein
MDRDGIGGGGHGLAGLAVVTTVCLRVNKSVYCTVRNFSYACGLGVNYLMATDRVNFICLRGSMKKSLLAEEGRLSAEGAGG